MRRGRDCQNLPRHFQWIWNGEPLDGKCVLVRCYHGLGDTNQFMRYVPLARRIAQSSVIWAQPQLIPLLQTLRSDIQFVPLHDGAPDCQYDVGRSGRPNMDVTPRRRGLALDEQSR